MFLIDSARAIALVTAVGLGGLGCANRNPTGELTPPKDAEAFSGQYSGAFDDDFTPESIELSGRAPNDVLDQRLFTSRLGHADLVILGSVNEVWGKGRYQGRQEQYVDLTLGEVLIGSLGKGTDEHQLFEIAGEDPVSTSLQGSEVLVFIKWAPGEIPPYHHHLMPAQDEAVSYVNALVKMAKDDGMLDDRGRETKRERRPKRKGGKKSKAGDNPALEIDNEQDL